MPGEYYCDLNAERSFFLPHNKKEFTILAAACIANANSVKCKTTTEACLWVSASDDLSVAHNCLSCLVWVGKRSIKVRKFTAHLRSNILPFICWAVVINANVKVLYLRLGRWVVVQMNAEVLNCMYEIHICIMFTCSGIYRLQTDGRAHYYDFLSKNVFFDKFIFPFLCHHCSGIMFQNFTLLKWFT